MASAFWHPKESESQIFVALLRPQEKATNFVEKMRIGPTPVESSAKALHRE